MLKIGRYMISYNGIEISGIPVFKLTGISEYLPRDATFGEGWLGNTFL